MCFHSALCVKFPISPRRYNLFIILYPLGVVGELMTIYAALPFVRRSGMYSMRLPNKYNVSFDYYYCLIIVMLSYIPRKKLFFFVTFYYIYIYKIINVFREIINTLPAQSRRAMILVQIGHLEGPCSSLIAWMASIHLSKNAQLLHNRWQHAPFQLAWTFYPGDLLHYRPNNR